MTKLRGRGIAAVNYPTGMNLGGDPSQALIHATTSGRFVVSLSSTDLGQGLRTVIGQIAAEAIGVGMDDVYIDTADTDSGPHCMGTFASRATHRVGNAVIAAAAEVRDALLDVAALELDVPRDDLDFDGQGHIVVGRDPARCANIADVASAAQFKYGRTIAGRGAYMKPKSPVDPETGEMDPNSTEAHACTVADVEVDTETGEVTVISLRSAFEVGRQVNPALVRGQIVGGAWMGMSHALYETTAPYYPNPEHMPHDFSEYLMPGAYETPQMECVVLEHPSANGPYGIKGVGEMTANSPIPAIVNAIYDATGVRIDELPVTPELILRGLDAKRAAPSPRKGIAECARSANGTTSQPSSTSLAYSARSSPARRRCSPGSFTATASLFPSTVTRPSRSCSSRAAGYGRRSATRRLKSGPARCSWCLRTGSMRFAS